MSVAATVFVVDPNRPTRDAVREIAHTMNLDCEAYSASRPFLEAYTPSRLGCLVLEIRIPDVNGLDVLDYLAAQESPLPVILLTGHATVSMAVRAMRAGALHVLEKPLREHELWETIHEAIAVDRHRRNDRTRRRERDERLAQLSRNEKRVLEMIAQGKSRKSIAAEMSVSVRTIEHRRTRLLEKLNLESSLDLLRFALVAFDANGGDRHKGGDGAGNTGRVEQNGYSPVTSSLS